MPKGSTKPDNRKKVRTAKAVKLFNTANKQKGLQSSLTSAAAVDTLTGKRKVLKKAQRKKGKK